MFLHPWAIIAGAVLAGLPVALHFLTKPRPVRLPLSTIRFVREAIHVRRARHRLRDFIVLALRTLAVVLVALAVARPQPTQQPLVSDAQAGSAVRIVVVDASQSMAALQRGVTALERARTMAATYLRYRPGLHANVIVAGARPQAVLTEPSQNFEALRDALAAVQVRKERCDVNRALAMAADMLAPSSPADTRRRELIVVSDFQRSNWAGAISPACPSPRAFSCSRRRPASRRPIWRCSAPNCVAAFRSAVLPTWKWKSETTRPRRVWLRWKSRWAKPPSAWKARAQQVGAPHWSRKCRCNKPAGTWGWPVWWMPMMHWSLMMQWESWPRSTSDRTIALVTRQPAEQRPSASHFLECGLVPDARRGESASAALTRMSPGKLNREALAAADLIAFDHPGKMAAEELQLLAGLLRRGHPLLYVASEIVDATNLSQLIETAGTDLQVPVAFAPPPAGQPRKDLFLTTVRQDAAPFDVFGEDSAAIVSRLRFAGGLSSHRRENTLEDDVLAVYNDGTACLVRTSSGAGALAVLNADLHQSNLPKAAAFVPLLDRLVQHLLERGQSSQRVVCGEPLVVRLPSGVGTAEQLQIAGPANVDAAHDLGTLADDGTGVVWRWDAPTEPGVYRVQRGSDTVFALPVCLAEDESQLDSLSADVLENRLAAGRAVQFRTAGSGRDQRDVMWSWLLVAGVLCVLGEITALLTFRS